MAGMMLPALEVSGSRRWLRQAQMGASWRSCAPYRRVHRHLESSGSVSEKAVDEQAPRKLSAC